MTYGDSQYTMQQVQCRMHVARYRPVAYIINSAENSHSAILAFGQHLINFRAVCKNFVSQTIVDLCNHLFNVSFVNAEYPNYSLFPLLHDFKIIWPQYISLFFPLRIEKCHACTKGSNLWTEDISSCCLRVWNKHNWSHVIHRWLVTTNPTNMHSAVKYTVKGLSIIKCNMINQNTKRDSFNSHYSL